MQVGLHSKLLSHINYNSLKRLAIIYSTKYNAVYCIAPVYQHTTFMVLSACNTALTHLLALKAWAKSIIGQNLLLRNDGSLQCIIGCLLTLDISGVTDLDQACGLNSARSTRTLFYKVV